MDVPRHVVPQKSHSLSHCDDDEPYRRSSAFSSPQQVRPSRSPRFRIVTFHSNRRSNSSGPNLDELSQMKEPFHHDMTTTHPRFELTGPPPMLRRESATRLFLKPDAVFKAYEEMESVEPCLRQHRSAIAARLRSQNSLTEEKDAASLKPVVSSQFKSTGFEPAQCFSSPQAAVSCTWAASSSRIHRSSSVQQSQTLLKPDEGRRRCSSAMEAIRKEDPENIYDVFKQLGTGRFGFVKLAQNKSTGKRVALKFFPRSCTKQADFLREYSYSKQLSAHPNVINSFDGVYHTTNEDAFYFVQEFCPHASLREAVECSVGGIGEEKTKVIMISVLNAVEYMHSEGLVHRNIKAENILIFDDSDFSQVKITDFGLTRKVESTVKHLEYTNQYHAPELCDTVVNEMCTVSKGLDVWALGILFYYCLRGKHPWQKASIMCKPYWEWEQWMKHKLSQLPRRYDVFTEKGIKLQKRCLNPRIKDRWTVKDIKRCMEKERLIKPQKNVGKTNLQSIDDFDDEVVERRTGRSSGIHHWISNTLSTMAEISEQVVSARNA
ncbi:unnamed protein product [Bursaphelenchus xylophilus]|uniref:(pine wood nematode) hypothetical protein n=1 Tax=Bursaphelenchus xylophilus TaxID=6326 RepID=A0A1I7STF9_BURXY|nr:unnamed protein product [Bursaphelenchus xylophilus]CAG9108457.1 unnamed protein product [Bursaphelenchus xylophilus]